ncbi:NUDIX hydrolase domain-like protein [Dunaliella salina]|uniref:NUDIX hydrolase domain-like protein n=1 Tax=Dunaliella salina TaxID=3046 RepID=A0ABQ7G3L1_DUNSA|nr:NUDIX hydrolase domain-like protein [Dunaliella salina]|eukprot:KAF5829200.1 NUDIX hydrolase domain-like protein [Dunaliella salina]
MASLQTAPPQSFSGVQAEADAEMFDVFDENEMHQGTQPRSVCHRNGLWHRAVYALLMNKQQELLIQRRSAQKKVSPEKWDLSAAEHLQPGETYLHAAARGLIEELGVSLPPTQGSTPASIIVEGSTESSHSGVQGEGHNSCSHRETAASRIPDLCARLKGPLAPRHPRQLDIPETGIKDYEFVETYSFEGYNGPVMYNSEEVSEVAWISIPELARRMKDKPDDFTPWFLCEARTLDWLGS